jgi:hypothetical protein
MRHLLALLIVSLLLPAIGCKNDAPRPPKKNLPSRLKRPDEPAHRPIPLPGVNSAPANRPLQQLPVATASRCRVIKIT